MSIKPILFNTEMVRAILDGRKTQTRRVIKTTDGIPFSEYSDIAARRFIYDSNAIHKSPYSIGDTMWVRETFDDVALGHPWFYKADGDLRPECWKGENWHPSTCRRKQLVSFCVLMTCGLSDCKRSTKKMQSQKDLQILRQELNLH